MGQMPSVHPFNAWMSWPEDPRLQGSYSESQPHAGPPELPGDLTPALGRERMECSLHFQEAGMVPLCLSLLGSNNSSQNDHACMNHPLSVQTLGCSYSTIPGGVVSQPPLSS